MSSVSTFSIPKPPISSRPPTARLIPSPDTSSALSDLFSEDLSHKGSRERTDMLQSQSFKDTLNRISSQHEQYKEDTPENDAAFQALFEPIHTAQNIQALSSSTSQEFISLHKSLIMPDRPKTSPSKLALSVVLKPDASEASALQHTRNQARLRLLAPLENQDGQPSIRSTQRLDILSHAAPSSAPTEEVEDAPRTLSMYGSDLEDVSNDDQEKQIRFKGLNEHREEAEFDKLQAKERLQKPLEPNPFMRKTGSPLKVTIPPTAQAAEVAPQPAVPEKAPSLVKLNQPSGSSPTFTSDAVLQSPKAQRVALSMEQSPQGQKLELEIMDSFGKPLTLKITFEHQRARAACFGSHFHDPAQLEYVIDSVRTALEASGYELGDFITHHQRQQSNKQGQHGGPGYNDGADFAQDDEAAAKKPREVLHVVGIINRIA